MRIGDAHASQHADGVPTHGVPNGGNSAAIQASGKARHRRLDLVKVIENEVHVCHPGTPEQRAVSGGLVLPAL